MHPKTRIAMVQMAMSKSQEDNLTKAVRLIGEAAKKGAQVVCLPELFNAEYFAQEEKRDARSYSDTIPGRITKALSEAAKANCVVLIGGSIYERSGGKFYNTSPVFDTDGSLLGTYRKTHIPHDELYYEQDYFESGDTGFKVFDTWFGKIGVLICFDQWYPEAARINALMGADIVLYPTAIGDVDGIEQAEGNWQSAWENVMRGYAIANGMFVCAVNRCGREGRMDFWGGSFVCDPFGATRVRADRAEGVLIADVDYSDCARVREGWRFFAERKPEKYKLITERQKK